jgi:alkanesulfonate monooxygenase SsuD/methylene tetrahydromethanopterin reductase-like flavin-dependent oxidoreductase (luciferase family)
MIKLGYFIMPVHPLHRDYTQTLIEDREAIILCDELGYHDAFVGEHLTDRAEPITNSMLFLATLIHSTKNIKLATGTTNLTHTHPTLAATHAAMFDHLSEGRFIFGVSPGTLRSDLQAIGRQDIDKFKYFVDSINVILEIWKRDAPYDIDLPDNEFTVSTGEYLHPDIGVGIMIKPYQNPHPEIVATVVAPFSKGVIQMGKRNFHPMSANFLMPKWVATHWNNYAEGCKSIDKTPNPEEWRIAKTIFVADDDKVAEDYAKTNSKSPYKFYYSQFIKKLQLAGKVGVFKHERDEPDEAVTVERAVDDLVICGSVNKVVDELLAFHDVVGDFGELVYAGMDWVDEGLSKRSMQLMAEEVMPRVNAALGTRKQDGI